MKELSFFITTSINNNIHNYCLNKCIFHIRENYKSEEIIIIVDNSNKDFIKLDFNEGPIRMIESCFKGAGESLFLYYYHLLKPSKKAVFIHDSMFLLEPIESAIIKNLTTIRPLLSFNRKFRMKEQEEFTSKLKNGDEIINFINKNNWIGCFGGSCIITLNFLEKLEEKYNITNLTQFITCRNEREVYERILGSIISCEEPTIENISLFGDLYEYFDKFPTNNYHNIYMYVNYFSVIKSKKIPLLKLNFGR